MKICFICNEYPPGPHGGIGTMTQVLARCLVSKGHEVRSVGVYPTNYTAPPTENDHGVEVVRVPERQIAFGWIASRYAVYRQVQRWIRAGQADVVEVPDYQGMAAFWPKLSVPVIARLHGSLAYFASELRQPLDKSSYWLERASLRRADFVSSVCQYTAKVTERVFKMSLDKTEILYNPVETRIDAEASRTERRVIFSGTLTEKKGIISLVKAWPQVLKSAPDSQLHIFGKDGRAAGGGSMQQFLRSLLNGHGTSVHFHGHVSRNELFQAYRGASAAVFPSYAEAFAIAPLEAMAAGCPTIFSERGSGPELLQHGRQGLLVDPDNPAQIADSILRVLSDQTFAQEIGEAGRAHVRSTFNIDLMADKNAEFYQRCLNEFKEPSSSSVRPRD